MGHSASAGLTVDGDCVADAEDIVTKFHALVERVRREPGLTRRASEWAKVWHYVCELALHHSSPCFLVLPSLAPAGGAGRVPHRF